MLKTEQLNFQAVIDIVESLPDEEQEHLIKRINNRLKQKQKQELLEAVKESHEAFIKGEVKSGTVEDLMTELKEK